MCILYMSKYSTVSIDIMSLIGNIIINRWIFMKMIQKNNSNLVIIMMYKIM